MGVVSRSNLKLQNVYHQLIGGEWVQSRSEQMIETINPATEEVLARFQAGNAEDIDAAVTAARRAFPLWRKTTVTERAKILNAIADTIEKNADEFALLETVDNGKPIREARAIDIPLSIDHFRYFASVIRAEENSSATVDGMTESYNYTEPLGVVGQIIPWNFPLMMAAWKLAPALAAGNCVVLKPAEETPLSVLELARKLHHLLPPGVLNVVTGYGPEAGTALAAHREVDMLAFTGSTDVGHLIAREAAKTMKPITLELGGKSPNIVFPDANLPKAIEGLVMAVALNQGEVRTCGSRALVHQDVYDRVKEAVRGRFEKMRVGDPLDEKTQMGALVSREQFNRVNSYLEYAQARDDHRILCGGNPVKRKGFFIQPTLVETHNRSKLAQEEIFGPVLTLISFRNEKEAIEIANDTKFGFGAGLWTRDVNRIHRMSQEIEVGRIWVNNYHSYPAHAPLGGRKESGRGRENHKMMLDSYRQNKNVLFSFDEAETGLFPA
jgi:aldehyde dehydrogenase